MSEFYDLRVLKRHGYLLTYGGKKLGPLADAPVIEPDSGTYDCLLYCSGQAVASSFIEKNEVKITVLVKDTDCALGLLQKIRGGEDLLASASSAALSFSPVVASGRNEKILTFPRAILLPEWRFRPAAGQDHAVEMNFRCIPDPATGVLFRW